MRTDELIERLARDARPVRPLAAPPLRAALWLAIALPFMVAMVLVISPRADLVEQLGSSRYLLEQFAALATAVAAAVAAFAAVVPGIDRRLIWLPAVPGAAWVASLGLGCVRDWLALGAEGLRVTPDPECLFYIAMIGSVPAVAMVVMLRRGAPVAPRLALFLAALAAAAVGSFGLRLFHTEDAGLMVLIWQFGSVALLAALGGLVGGRLLNWRHRLD